MTFDDSGNLIPTTKIRVAVFVNTYPDGRHHARVRIEGQQGFDDPDYPPLEVRSVVEVDVPIVAPVPVPYLAFDPGMIGTVDVRQN